MIGEPFSDGTFWSDGTGWIEGTATMPGPAILFQETFWQRNMGAFDSLEGSGNDCIFFTSHYHNMVPMRGAYAMVVDAGKIVTEPKYLKKSIAVVSPNKMFGRIPIFISSDFKAEADGFLEFFSVNHTSSVAFGVFIRRDRRRGALLSVVRANHHDIDVQVPFDQWFQLRFGVTPHGSTGSINLSIEDIGWSYIAFNLNVPSITEIKLGNTWQGKTITDGFIAFNDVFITSDEDPGQIIGPTDVRNLDNANLLFTYNDFAFRGSGVLNSAQLIESNIDNAVELYDTFLPTPSYHNLVARLTPDIPRIETELQFKNGCLVKMTGTGPQALLQLGEIDERWDEPMGLDLGEAMGEPADEEG
jgi:hypothetical protein